MNDHDNFLEWIASVPDAMQRLHVPGAAVGIQLGEQEYSAGFGVTNLENPLTVDADTLFQTGSITKTVTATALMRLKERGLIDLETPLRTLLPELRLADEQVTAQVALRHLLTHTGGWLGDYFGDAGEGDDALARVVAQLHTLPQETPLGEIWSYNNAGFFIAGRLVEALTGKPYEIAAHELVLEPLGMARSFFFARDAITYRVSAGHKAVYPGQEVTPQVLRPWWLARASNPVGGLLATIHDMLRYARFHLGDGRAPNGERLLNAAALEQMRTPITPAANGEWMGLSWFLREVDGVRIVRHGGATNGQMAMLQFVPQRQFALVILTNSDRGSELYRILAAQAFERFLGLVEPVPTPWPPDAQVSAEFVGVYTAAAQNLHLSLQEGELVLQDEPKGGFPTPEAPPPPAAPPTRLRLCAPDCVVALDEPHQGVRGEFLRDVEGRIAWLRISGRVHRRA